MQIKNKTKHNKTNKQTTQQTNKQPNKQTNKQTSKQTNKKLNKQTNKQPNKQTNKQNKRKHEVLYSCFEAEKVEKTENLSARVHMSFLYSLSWYWESRWILWEFLWRILRLFS